MNQTTTFECSICGEASTEICVYCAKDTCGNHLCRRCRRCSDCCECEAPLNSEPEAVTVGTEPKAEELVSKAEALVTKAEELVTKAEELFSTEPAGTD